MMESSPTAPLIVVEAEFVLHFLEVSFNAPAQLDQTDEIIRRGCFGSIREPVLGRLRLRLRPLDHEPFFCPRSRAPIVAMSGAHSTKSKARLHRSASPLTPTDFSVRRGRKLAGKLENGYGPMPRRASQQFRRATHALPTPWRQRRTTVGPYGDFLRNPNCVGKSTPSDSFSELRDDAVASVRHNRCPRQIVREQSIDLFEGNPPLGLKANLGGNATCIASPPIPAPLLCKVQPPRTGHAHRAVGQ